MALLDGKVAVVTGAGAGIGRAYVRALAREGAAVVVNDFAREAAEDAVAEIVGQGGRAVANVADVGALEGGASLLSSALEAFGRVDILVNNAGILRDASLVKMEEAQWDAVMHVHLKGLYSATRPIFGWMKDNGGGVIVNTTSTAGIRGNFGQSNYGAAKCGVIGFTNSLAIEGRKYGIRLWNIGPAAATALTAHMPEEYQRRFQIDRVAPTLLYMVSHLSGDQTGKTLLAGGGWVGEVRFEVHDGYEPSDDFTAEELARAVADGKVLFPDRDAKWVTAYGPSGKREG
ncbi:SDR family NAD(P)-dependent oxidoreductase [Sphingomonas histidinilytica]|jgi:NAD(P)-dependent dehydrogenase (short-subunit alcohol dehydrogenase family)|uniref:NADP-dependent 3-hydroxy acid dehydrogenase YdfG n=1 Tax=Rhizorhabdus histidinilytica TaxID=439228 RepID=A0A1T5ER44_9SPHN|nr:SDR family NAD(P)-dependent oxidoreductase [Rhizorhabdus histidinilytica]MBO9376648.1 SDR family NAD(P)-dependent oxidoreductase [Rhizorhabdus histidinilytica]QEH76901.1 SDR family NAD(P)-dependent oxidoreductase [Sphingomonas sp. C8-2]SKB86417.1 NADP-dependent 3-hydroxy acid dehydrogenase YdfG [Rhizorhabdus histidinilytica]